MPSSRFHKSKVRRAERAHMISEHLNLVPLVDILTSIVFFSLLTYTGAAVAILTAFDLSLPPVVVTAQDVRAGKVNEDNMLKLLLAVRIQEGRIRVEHSGGQQRGIAGFRQEIGGLGDEQLDQFQALMATIRRQYPQNDDVLVVPDDATSYEDVVRVLDRIRMSEYTNISLGTRARTTQVAAAGGGRR